MKKVLFIIVALSLAIGVNAQRVKKATVSNTRSSNIYVGGGITFESTSDETAFAIVPEIGYKLSDKWGLGVRLGYGTSGSGDSSYSIFSFKPYVRQNLLSFGQIGFLLDYQILYQNEGIKDNKTNTFGIGVAPGLAVNLSPQISVVTHIGFLGYTSSKLDVEGAEAVNKFTLQAGSENIGLSLYYNF